VADQLDAKTRESGVPQITRLPRSYWSDRTAPAIFITAGGLAIIGLIFFLVAIPYTFTNARYVRQASPPHREQKVEVRFAAPDHGTVTAYVYPGSDHLNRREPVPIFYENTHPQNAFYATQADRRLMPLWFAFGGCVVLAGVSLLFSAVRWRRRIAAMTNQTEKWQAVELYYWKNLQMVAVAQEGGTRYTWSVFRRTIPSKEVSSSSDNSNTADTQATQRPSWFYFLHRIRTRSASWPAPIMAEVSGDLQAYRWFVVRAPGQLMLPSTRAYPVIGTAHATVDPPAINDELVTAHRRLLAAYVTVRAQVRLLPRFAFVYLATEDESKLERTDFLCLRLLVQLHTDYDIRRQVRQIADTYLRAELLITDISEKANKARQRLAELRQDCDALIGLASYTTGRRVSAVLGLATLLPLITIVAKVPQLQFMRFLGILLTVFIIGLSILPGGLMLIAYNHAYRCKRQLFATRSLNIPTTEQRESVYELEAVLLSLIRQTKRPERPSERWVYGIIVAALITFIILAAFASLFSLLIFVAISWIGILFVAFYPRRWHRQL
jgi:hypothetical protein